MKKHRIDYRVNPCHETFTCKVCGRLVTPEGAGSRHRNHCPNCLSSLHVDDTPGDRAADCGGVMEPVAVWVRKGGEWAVIHRCRRCGALSSNRVAGDDNPVQLLSLAARPLAQPPFPLELLERMADAMGYSLP
ncbi:RNHCP domain-containing protein [Pseudoflavonifractor phocaeensis]|uniref:RNHCP domain-containing protein n=1 Tax=Pseudoflavonifractor phocaeensis TaxID=1870988 RepID=UPI00313B45FD